MTNKLMICHSFWIRKIRKNENRHLLFIVLILAGQFLFPLGASGAGENLLVNPGAENNYTGWSASGGGSGWGLGGGHTGSKCWSSSYDPCTLTQVIDLVALGYDTTLLDAAPDISAGAFVTTSDYSSGYVTIRIQLLNKAGAVIKTGYAVNNQEMNHKYWLLKYTTISGYGEGMRKIRISMTGEGTRYWAGQYGPSFDDAFVYLITGPKAISDDIKNISIRSATFNGLVYPGNKTSTVQFQYGTTADMNNKVIADQSPVSGTTPVVINKPMTLKPNTTYYSRLMAFNDTDTSYGDLKTFHTPDVVLTPFATALNISDTLGSRISVNITSTITWTASTDVPWLSVTPSSATGNGTILLTVTEPNMSQDPRTATLTLSGDTLQNRQIIITQKKGTLYISPKTVNSNSDAKTLAIKVRTHYKWAASTVAPWISIPTDSVNGSAVLNIGMSENAGSADRTAKIAISNRLVSDTIVIVQKKGVITITPSNMVVGVEAGTYEMSIGTNFTWAAGSDSEWLIISSDSISGNSTIAFSVDENTTGLERSARITISNCRISNYIIIKQKALKGKGTADEPYLISNYNGLKSVKNDLNAYYLLINDIDATASLTDNSGKGFIPIAVSDYFMGNFNGNGFKIKNLYMNQTGADNISLFGTTFNAVIKNLGLINCNIKGKYYSGGIVGQGIQTTIENCFVSGKITGNAYTGGLGGMLFEATINKCYMAGVINSSYYGGGILGLSYFSTVSNCYSIANITGRYSGGLIGESDGSVSNCYAAGKVSGTSVGGLIGSNMGGSVTSCYYNRDISMLNDNTNGLPLATKEMKMDTTYKSWNFNDIWIIHNDSTYPALRTVNNAPFAFRDTVLITGYTPFSNTLMRNDFDAETLQDNLVVKVSQISGTGIIESGWFTFPPETSVGTISSFTYRAGEVLVSNDTLWGGESTAILKKVENAPPVAQHDTITMVSGNAVQILFSTVLDNDSDPEENRIEIVECMPAHHGSINVMNEDLTYLPDSDWMGFDSVTYVMSDGDQRDTAVISIKVLKMPEITWVAPADIAYGEALGTQQLNASSEVAGQFAYNPEPGTILNAGNSQDLSVLFTPEPELEFYIPTSKMVQINVLKAVLDITANNQTITAGTDIPELTYTISGLLNNDEISDLDELPAISTTATISSDPGPYVIALTGGEDNNYIYHLTDGVLEIVVNTGINDRSDDLLVYPNPFTDNIYLSNNPSGEIAFSVFSATGELTDSGIISDGRIDLSHLNPGVYILKIRLNGVERYFKVIKK